VDATSIPDSPVVAYPDEPLRIIVYRMAETGRTELPVVSREDRTPIGVVALSDLLTARTRILDSERRRERVFGLDLWMPALFGGSREDSAA
jgi:CBS domain-containing protein